MKRLFFVLAVSVFVLPVFAQQAQKAGKVLRVPQQFKSIQRALDEAEPGDTVFLDEGTYKEPVVLRDDVVLTGVSAERTVLMGDRKKPVVRGAQGAVIRNVSIENGQMGIQCANTVMTIENCVIRGNRGTGIHCLIALPIIQNNIIFRNHESGIYLETTRSHKGHISHNVIAESGYSGIMLAGQSEALIENNVLYFNKQYGIFTAEGARRSRIINNSFYGNRHPGNTVSQIDRSNIQQDPGYTTLSPTGYAFWDTTPDMLKGKGKDGKDIGPARPPLYKLSAKPEPKPEAKQPAPPPVKAEDKKTVAKDAKADVKKNVAEDIKVEEGDLIEDAADIKTE